MDRNKLIEDKAERVVLVSVISGTVTDRQVNEYLDELEFLAQTAGAVTLKKFTQKLPVINQKSYVGAGKLSEIKEYVIENDGVVFGATFDKNFEVYHTYVSEKEQLEMFRGSKYVQSRLESTFAEVRNF